MSSGGSYVQMSDGGYNQDIKDDRQDIDNNFYQHYINATI